jgi:hypothetical protein
MWWFQCAGAALVDLVSRGASGPPPALAPTPAPGRAARKVVIIENNSRDAGDDDNDDWSRLGAARRPRGSSSPPEAVRATVPAATQAPNCAPTFILPPRELIAAELQDASKAAPSRRCRRAGAAAATD